VLVPAVQAGNESVFALVRFASYVPVAAFQSAATVALRAYPV
jgi:hypothetical protein